MSKSLIIAEAAATGEEINAIIDQIEPVFAQFPPDHCIIAALCMVASLMNPYASADEVEEVVYQASQYMCLALDGKGDAKIVGSPDKGVMN